MQMNRRDFIKSCFAITGAVGVVAVTPPAVAALADTLQAAVPQVDIFPDDSVLCWLDVKGKDYTGHIPLVNPIRATRKGNDFLFEFATIEWEYGAAEVVLSGWRGIVPSNPIRVFNNDTLRVAYTLHIDN